MKINDSSVTVVIPCYHKRAELEFTLNALLPQTVEGDEIIVSDDGSTDGTAKMISEQFPQVSYIRHPREGYRTATTRNRGIAKARNDFIWLLDPDCVPHPLCLEIIRKVHRPDHLTAGRIDKFNENGTISFDPRLVAFGWAYHFTFGGNLCFSREAAIKVGLFCEEFNGAWGANETDFAMKMQLSGITPIFNPNAVVFHLWHPKKWFNEDPEGYNGNRDLWLTREAKFRNSFAYELHLRYARLQNKQRFSL